MAEIESTQPATRRERERLARRNDIIHAARTVFASKGFNDAKLEDVAERAEFGKGTLYNYFTNKEDLFKCVLEDSFQETWMIAEESLTANVSFSEKIERFIHGELEYFFNNPQSLYLMMRESHHLRGSNPMMQLLPQLLTLIADTIAAEQKKKKVIANADSMDLATILIDMLFGQFTSRVYRKLCLGAVKGESNENLTNLFDELDATEIEKEIVSATKLIHTVYFNGITR